MSQTQNKANAVAAVQGSFQQALALHRKGELAQASSLYAHILELQPRHFDALHLQGVIALQRGNPALALELISQALQINPADAAAHFNRGKALSDLDQHQAALESHDRAIALKPDYAEAHNNRGNALHKLDQIQAALASYDKAIALKPHYAIAYNNRGNVLRALNQDHAALESYARAIAIRPDYAEAHNNSGVALSALQQSEAALQSYDRALASRADYAEAWNNRGVLLLGLGQSQAALDSFDRAIAIRPEYADAFNNRGNALRDLSRHAAATISFEKAIDLQPNEASGHWNLALCDLQTGNFERGWEKYEWRWKLASGGPIQRHLSQALWLGKESLQGKTILLHADQGFGDTLQFCRYAQMVSSMGARVILQAQQGLLGVLASLAGVAQLVANGAELPAFDFHCPLSSLPLAFRTRLNNIPVPGAYLHASAASVSRWQTMLGPALRPRVGLVWSGRATHINDHNRSVSLAEMLACLPAGLQYVSLQKELRGADSETLRTRGDVFHVGGELRDFDDTAALCGLMDVVLSVDTSVAHLAGALGRETWVMLPANPDWRWLLDRNDSPWYQSVRLYRQALPRQWAPVFAKVGADLRTKFALQGQST